MLLVSQLQVQVFCCFTGVCNSGGMVMVVVVVVVVVVVLVVIVVVVEFFLSHISHSEALILSCQPDISLHCKTRDTWLMHRAVCLFTPQLSFTGTHFTYPWKDGQAEFT